MSTLSPVADRNLIFGLLALQMDFVAREQLLDAMSAWMLHKSTPLGDILRERGVLGERRLKLLDEMVEEHISQHGDAGASLSALRVEVSLRRDLDGLDDADVQASLASLAPPTRSGTAEESASSPATVALPLPEREKRAEQYARAAVALLGRLAAAGSFHTF